MFFYAWLSQELLTSRPGNSVIVLDNATFHQRREALEAIEKAGHRVEFLPPESPDLNPIEKNERKQKVSDVSLDIRPMNFFQILIYDVLS